jgi:hypothetical protein
VNQSILNTLVDGHVPVLKAFAAGRATMTRHVSILHICRQLVGFNFVTKPAVFCIPWLMDV